MRSSALEWLLLPQPVVRRRAVGSARSSSNGLAAQGGPYSNSHLSRRRNCFAHLYDTGRMLTRSKFNRTLERGRERPRLCKVVLTQRIEPVAVFANRDNPVPS